MYHHVKKLMYTVRVDAPDPRFGNMLLEQFGGGSGELAAARQYPARKDLLMDIGTEELSHPESKGLPSVQEENADKLLNQLARPLMSAARMPEPVA
jgi:hypothetical protein